MNRWSSWRPTRSPSKSPRRRPARLARSAPRMAKPSRSVPCSDRSMMARREPPPSRLQRLPRPRHRPRHRPPQLPRLLLPLRRRHQPMRGWYKDVFEKKHGIKLGFMGFFTKACVQALKDIPAANAEIDGTDLIYKNYYHIGVAVGTDRGLVVPVVRDCDQKSIAEIEKSIADFGRRARDGQLKIEEMQGGTFTITNGGIYGSLMSTPILNAPQSGILGMHKIQDRPVVIAGKVEIRPMMYLALSYDHRVIDGKEAVTFLVRVKES